MTVNRPLGLIVLVCALALAGLAAVDAARNALTELNPVLAAKLPGSEGAQVELISMSLGQPKLMPPKHEVFAAARARLREEPLDSSALNSMAYASDPQGRSSEAARYADVATRVSKRTTFSQLVMTFVALKSNDVPASIDRFDAVLRARPDAGPLFFPYLKQSLGQSDIRAALADLAAQDSPWVMNFLADAGNDDRFTAHAADVVLLAGYRIPEAARSIYVGPLLSHAFDGGHYAEARKLVTLIPGGSAVLFDSPALTARSIDARYGRAAWQFASSSTGSTSAVQRPGKSFAMSIYATGGAHDVLASKDLLVRPGTYRLVQQLETAGQPDDQTRAAWKLTCIGRSEIWHSVNLLAQSPPRRLGPIEVPTGCPAQRLELTVDVGFGHPAIDMTLRAIALERVDRPIQ